MALELFSLLIVILNCVFSSSTSQELGVLILVPEPKPKYPFLFQPAIADGPELFLAAELAADLVRHNSSILQGYNISLVKGDTGCSIPFRAIEGFAKPFLQSIHNSDTGMNIVGAVGPACSLSSLSVSALSGRSELALINVHLSGTPMLNNRNLYPYSFGILDSGELIAMALASLKELANWKKVAVFYDTSRAYHSSVAQELISEESVDLAEDIVVGISSIALSPIHLVRNKFRVIFLLVGTDLLSKILCIAHYNGYSSPTYQYVLVVDSVEAIDSVVDFSFESKLLNCTKIQIRQVLEGSILIHYQLKRPENDLITASGISLNTFKEMYQKSSSQENIYAMAFFDATWAFLMALNASINTIDLSSYKFGQQDATDWIREELYNLDFEGLSGRVRFNRATGRVLQNASIFWLNETDTTKFAYYSRDKDRDEGGIFLFTENNVSFTFVKSNFDKNILAAPKLLVSVVLLLSVLGFILTFLLNAFTCIYRNMTSVKASSVKLNQVAFIGCYIHVVSIIFAVLIYGFSDEINQHTVCKIQHVLDFSITVGLTILFGAISVRIWRLYKIFIHFQNPGRLLSDRFLSAAVMIMVVIHLCFVMPSFFIDVYQPKLFREAFLNSDNSTVVIPAILRCQRKNFYLWFINNLLVSAVLLIAIFILAILTRKIPQKNFKSKSIIHMSYTLTVIIPFILGIYFIFSSASMTDYVSMIVRFCTVCVLLLCLIFIPCAMLFFPPLLPIFKKVRVSGV